MMKQTEIKRALFVGIDDYPKAQLRGCVNDAEAMKGLLRQHADGSANFFPVKEVAGPVTKDRLEERIEEFFQNQEVHHALFFFAGHGYFDQRGGFLVAQDRKGIEMSWLADQINTSPIHEITLILDCCHSGAAFNTEDKTFEQSTLRKDVTVLTACRNIEEAAEVREHGVFTSLLLQGLHGAAADTFGQVTASGLYDLADTMLNPNQQRPVFKSFCTRMSPLRRTYRRLSDETLTVLRQYRFFPNPDKQLQLSPRWISNDPDRQPIKVQELEYLFAFYRAGLMVCEDNLSPYRAALNSRTCTLTPYGRFMHQWSQQKL